MSIREVHYKQSIEPTRVYRNVLKFVHGNNEYSDGNFGIIFSFVYFDLTNQKLDIKDERTYKVTFQYELSYYNHRLFYFCTHIFEQDVELPEDRW